MRAYSAPAELGWGGGLGGSFGSIRLHSFSCIIRCLQNKLSMSRAKPSSLETDTKKERGPHPKRPARCRPFANSQALGVSTYFGASVGCQGLSGPCPELKHDAQEPEPRCRTKVHCSRRGGVFDQHALAPRHLPASIIWAVQERLRKFRVKMALEPSKSRKAGRLPGICACDETEVPGCCNWQSQAFSSAWSLSSSKPENREEVGDGAGHFLQ